MNILTDRDNELFELIEKFDSISFKKYNKIKCGSALHLKILHSGDHIKFFTIIKKIIKLLLECDYIKNVVGDGSILFFYSNANRTRQYVYDKMEHVEKLCENKISLKPKKRMLHISRIKDLYLIIIWLRQLRFMEISMKKKINICLYLLEGLYEIQSVSKLIKKDRCRLKLAFSVHDTRFIDSIVIQFLNHYSITTATLQHAEFAWEEVKLDVGLSFSKYFCIYGEYTKRKILSCCNDDEKYIKLGMPHMIGVEKIEKKEDAHIFGVFLNFIRYEEDNYKLIDVANQISQKYDMKYILKLHPSLNIKNYTNIDAKFCESKYQSEVSAYECARMIDFAIVSKSTIFGEFLYLGLPTFRYCLNDDSDYYRGISEFKFSNLSEFDEFFENGNLSEFVIQNMKEVSVLISGFGDTTEKYKEFIRSVCNAN